MTERQPSLLPTDATQAAGNRPYTVLARKYRPQGFAELVGQGAMVRVLVNAIKTGRVAQAFMLTGVRGVGKTTTARIIARALNCVGPDGKGGPTAEPCGACEHCKAIAEDRHVDVIEMDAASRTGVDNIRDLTDGVRYKPVSARYKVYIVDEVHMLSTQAFNALLKTLEEPPPHVKFVFATTEIRKVPVTVLSRCQRFDLRRVDHATLVAQYARIAEREKIKIEPAALALIARAADGSVRDGLSLLDQAIALGVYDSAHDDVNLLSAWASDLNVDEASVRAMLGLADRVAVFDLFEQVMGGKTAEALERLGAMYAAGADPAVAIEDLLELTHWLTRLRLVPEAADQPGVAEAERVRGKALAEKLSLATLTRNWQILLKGLGEVQAAPSPIQAAEMVLVRLAYAAELPNPADLVRTLQSGAESAPRAGESPRANEQRAGESPRASKQQAGESPRANDQRAGESPRAHEQGAGESPRASEQQAGESPRANEQPPPAPVLPPPDFAALAALVGERREAILHAHLETNVHLVRYEPGRLEFRPKPNAPPNLANQLGRLLGEWTGKRWVVSVSNEKGEPTLREQRENRAANLRREAVEHPLVRAVLGVFPEAAITAVRERAKPAPAEADAVGDPEDDAEGAEA